MTSCDRGVTAVQLVRPACAGFSWCFGRCEEGEGPGGLPVQQKDEMIKYRSILPKGIDTSCIDAEGRRGTVLRQKREYLKSITREEVLPCLA